jgi:hypothetical protein
MPLFLSWVMRFLLMGLCSPLLALDQTVLIDLEQSWSREASSYGKVALKLELSQGLTDNSDLTAILRAQSFTSDGLEPGEPGQYSVSPASQRAYPGSVLEVELRELYWDIGFDRANLRLGKQQVVWGQADGLKLLDVINPQDFREFILDDFDESRIPLWMVNLEVFLGVGDLQLLWIPDTSMHDLPTQGSTFEITAPFESIPDGVPVHFEPVDRPDSFFKDSDLGLRLSLFVDGWDLTINYLYHYDDFPVVRKQAGVEGLRLLPSYERTHTFGGSASNAFGDFILRTELVFNSHKYIDTNTLINQGVAVSQELGYVIGVDWTGFTDTFVSIQVFQSKLLDYGDYVRDDTDTNLTFLLRRSFLNESLNFEMLWVYHQNDADSLLRLSAGYELTSNTTVSVFADFFIGRPDELFGQFNDQDRIGIKVGIGF